jgi:predicted nucleotidyltransferase
MIAPSQISAEAHAHIRRLLEDLAVRERVRILFAVESGSRAWGFPSADSDYDVRFVYVRLKSDYLSVQAFRDVIETPTLDDPMLGVPLDLNGWDLRKALRLGLASNPVLHEWLKSPIVYARDESATSSIHDLVAQAVDPKVLRYHYDRLCRSARNQMQEPGGATIKRYCYALRPALMLLWLSQRDDLPPMDVHSLCAGLSVDEKVIQSLGRLIDSKQEGAEHDLAVAADVLDALIRSQLKTVAARPETTDMAMCQFAFDADRLFLHLVETGE